MKLTQGTFSFLPDLTDAQISAQVAYCLAKGWAISIEYTDDPHPRNAYWEMYGQPMFDLQGAASVTVKVDECRKAFPDHYVKINAFDATHGWESLRLSFIVSRPKVEPGFELRREESAGRMQRYSIRSYATARPEGERYR